MCSTKLEQMAARPGPVAPERIYSICTAQLLLQTILKILEHAVA